MSKFGNYQLEKAKLRLQAANARPERPRVQEQLNLEKSLIDMNKELTSESKKNTEAMFGELSNKWKGQHGGSAGDAFITGLTSGLKEGSFLDDKKRYKRLMDFTEKMHNMVADQNMQLFKEEKLFNARKSVMPRIMAYLDGYNKMSPNDRKVYLQNSMDEYNQLAGKDYKILDATGSEPWKVIISDNGDTTQIDLMDFIKTPEEKKLDYYLKSSEMNQYENELKEDDRLNREVLKSKILFNKEKLGKESTKGIADRKQKLIESFEIPEDAILFDEIKGPELKLRLEEMKIEKEKAKGAKNGLKALNEMGEIFKKHPNISTSLAKWANSKEDTLFGNIMKNIVNQDERNALIQLEKHAARLAIGTIEQFKGMRPTDILKKLIKETNPGSNFTYEAFVPVANQYSEEFNEQLERSMEADRGFIKRYVPSYSNLKKTNSVKEIPAQESERDKIVREIEEIEARRQNG